MKHRSVLLGAVICAFLLLLILNTQVPAQATADVEGHVFDKYGDPIPGAEVQLLLNDVEVNTTFTDDQGYYHFNDVGPGNYSVIVFVDTIIQQERTVEVDGLVNGTIIIVDFNFDNWPEVPGDDDDADEDSMGTAICPAIFLVAILFFIGVLVVIIIIWKQYSKITSEKLMEHETRQRILTFIKENPGGHLRGIKEGLGLPMGVLTHHVYKMEQEEVIKSRMDGKYRRFYPYNYKITKSPLLTGTQKTIMEHIQKKPGISPTEIADELGKSRKTVYYHVQELEAKGVVNVDRADSPINCFLNQDT